LSGGKDNYVRLWKFYSEQDALQQLQPENAKGVKELKLAGSRVFKVKLESVLQGHNEEVSSIAYGLCSEQVKGESEYFIASASFDYNIIIWKQDIESGLWMMKSRVG
jgi:elongator complex protein 2